jgi:hypothetical protein
MSVKRRARGRQPQLIRIKSENKVIDYFLTNGILEDRASVLERVRTLQAHAALLLSRLNKVSSTEETSSDQDCHNSQPLPEQNGLTSSVTKSDSAFEQSELH